MIHSRWMRPTHLVWAAAVLVTELAASASYVASHEDGIAASVASIVMFCPWPALCPAILPFVGRSQRA